MSFNELIRRYVRLRFPDRAKDRFDIVLALASHALQKIDGIEKDFPSQPAKEFCRANLNYLKMMAAYSGEVTTGRPAKVQKRRRQEKKKHGRTKPSTAAFGVNPTHNDFLRSFEWRQLRMMALKQYGARCVCCGATPADGIRIHVDHIKPRRDFPELALKMSNLQILCEDCNHGKGNWDQTDWR